jgi:hypothetical protein
MESPSAEATTSTAIQVMNKIPEVLSKVIDTLAQKFGSTGEALWAILVKQQFVYAFQYFITAVVFGGAILIWWYYVYDKMCKKFVEVDPEDKDAVVGTITGFGMAFTLIFLIVSFYSLYWGVAYLVNPQYFAIQDLMAMVKGATP